ncbi:MAG: hypothetical protein CMF49_05235 [Legionellales bacterium]|nr:hypothetical protein [Legionellales bacterium]
MASKTAKKTTGAKGTASKKPVAKKTAAAKKPTAKKAAPAKATASKGLPKNLKFSEPATNSEITAMIAEATGLTKKDVSAVIDNLGQVIHGHIKKNAAGVCKIAGLMKIEVKRKPAVKARKGINPFTGEETTFKAKPACNVVKIRPLKKMKEMV